MPDQIELLTLPTVVICPTAPVWARTGAEVGAGRWPEVGAGKYGRAWKGWILALDDPRAWAGSIRFGNRVPSKQECASHVQWCQKQGLLVDEVPVRWEFGKVLWQKFGLDRFGVKPYLLDELQRRKANEGSVMRRAA